MNKLSKKKEIWKKQFLANDFTSVEQILKVVTENKLENFNATIDLVFTLNLDLKKSGHSLKGIFVLPFPQKKDLKICVLTEKFVDQAEKMKPFLVGGKDVINEIAKNSKINFDLLLATPEIMPQLNRIAKILGPKKLMPSVKTQTLGLNIAEMITAWRNGQTTYSVDNDGNLHLAVGKVNDSIDKLLANINFCHQQVLKIKPNGVKGAYVKNIHLSTTMGPAFKLTKLLI